jgi:hypothetical protein
LQFLNLFAPGRIRTCGLRLRRPLLYPAELREHIKEQFTMLTIGQKQVKLLGSGQFA